MRKLFMDIKVTNVNKVGADIMYICLTFDNKKTIYIEMNDFNCEDLEPLSVSLLPTMIFTGCEDSNIDYYNGNTNCYFIRCSQAEASMLIVNNLIKNYGKEPFTLISAKNVIESNNFFILLNELKENNIEFKDKIENTSMIYDIITSSSIQYMIELLHLNDKEIIDGEYLRFINKLIKNLNDDYTNSVLKTHTLFSLFEIIDNYKLPYKAIKK